MNMIKRLVCLLLWMSPCLVIAQDVRTLDVRAVLNDPVNPGAEFYFKLAGGGLNKVPITSEGALSAPTKIEISGGMVAVYANQTGDAKTPPPVLAAAPVPSSVQRCILVISPASPGGKTPYVLSVIDDSGKTFAYGNSRVINLTPVGLAMQVGKARLELPAGKVTPFGEVKDLNDYNMAQTDFYVFLKERNQWTAFTERPVQYLKNVRYIFIIHMTPGSVAPMVSTVADYEAPAAPAT